MTSSLEATERLLSTYPPSSIQVSPTELPNVLRWDFWFPSALHVIVELSLSQSLRMAGTVENIFATAEKRPTSYGTQLPLFQVRDSAQPGGRLP